MMRPNQGICVGGPLAGKRLDHRGSFYRIAKWDGNNELMTPSLHPVSPEAQVVVEHDTYRYNHNFLMVDGQVVPAWLHHTVGTVREGIMEILRDYCRTRQ